MDTYKFQRGSHAIWSQVDALFRRCGFSGEYIIQFAELYYDEMYTTYSEGGVHASAGVGGAKKVYQWAHSGFEHELAHTRGRGHCPQAIERREKLEGLHGSFSNLPPSDRHTLLFAPY